jgi:murein DD-endopeptidase MepM/ murein hydrolase activator NlpD
MINTNNFFKRNISIRNPAVPYKKGKFIDQSAEYKSRVFSRVQESPLTKTLLSMRKNVLGIENALRGLFELDKKKQVTDQKFDLAEKQEAKDKPKVKPKTPKIFGNIVERPKTGIIDAVKNFVTFTFLGWLFTRLQPFIDKAGGLVPLLENIMKFFSGLIVGTLNAFASFLKFGYDVKDTFDLKIKEIKKEAEGISKHFDNTLGELKTVFSGAIEIVNSFLNTSVDEGELKTARQDAPKDSPETNIPPLPKLPDVATVSPSSSAASNISRDSPTGKTSPQSTPISTTSPTIYKVNTGGRIDPTKTPITRVTEQKEKRVIRRKPDIQQQKTVPGKDVGGEDKVKEVYGEETGTFKSDLIPNSIFFRTETKSGYAGLLKAAEEYKRPNDRDILGLGNLMGATVDTALGQKLERRTITQFADGIKYLVEQGMSNPEEFKKIDLELMLRRIIEPKIEAAINKIRDEVNKKSAVELSPGEEGDYYGDGSEVSGSEDFALLVAIAALESGAAQGQADVAQSVYNRLADKTYGKTLSEVLLADAQYQPAYIDPNSSSGPGTKTDPIFKKITDENSAIDAMASYYSKKGVKISRSEIQKQYRSAAAALANPSLQENARKHVGGRTEFLGRPTTGAVWRGSGADNRFFVAYGSGTQMSRGAASIPGGLFDSEEGGSRERIGKFNFLGGGQDPGQVGIDFTLSGNQNIAVLPGRVVDIQHQYNPNSIGGDGRRGAGYGWYVVIRSKSPVDNSEVDIIYSHFPKNAIKVREGQSVAAGQILGRMATAQEFANPNTRKEVGSGTGPHSSLDFYSANGRSFHPNGRKIGGYILNKLQKGDISTNTRMNQNNMRGNRPTQIPKPPDVQRITQTPPGEPYRIRGKMYYVDLKNNRVFTTNEKGDRVEVKVGPGQNEWLLKEIYKMRQLRQNQKISFSKIPPTTPAEKYASYNQPDSQKLSYIQPIIIKELVPVSTGSGSIIAFAPPSISNDKSQSLSRG